MPLPDKTTITQIQLGDPAEPTIFNDPLGDLEQNIDDLRTFLNDGMLGYIDYDPDTTTGLTFGYTAGVMREGSEISIVSAGTIVMTASTTNYVFLQRTSNNVWSVSKNTAGFASAPSNSIPLFTIVAGVSSLSTITDQRTFMVDSVDKDYVDNAVSTPPSGLTIPYWQKLTFATSTNDTGHIYKYEPVSNESHLRIATGDDAYSDVDIVDIGSLNGATWTSGLRIAASGNVTYRENSPWMLVPIGGIMMWGTTSVPSGWLECAGQAVSRTTYANLFAVLGTTYGVGDGSTTFNLPDMRGEFVRGYDNGRGVDSGRTIGSSQAEDVPDHNHQWYEEDDNGSSKRIDTTTAGGAASTFDSDGTAKAMNSYELYGDCWTSSQLDFGTGENRPRNVALMFIIKY